MSRIKYYSLKNPVTAQIELTPRCTNRCIYCYNHWRYDAQEEKELSSQDFSKVIDELVKAELFELVFTGGEPLLRRDILYPSIQKAAQSGISSKINSNIVLLDDADIKKFKDLSVDGVLTSLVSYDANKHNMISGANVFDKVVRNIEKLVSNNISCGVSMVILRENKDDVYKTGKFLHENFGLKVFCATPISPCSSSHKDFELCPSEIEKVLAELKALEKDFGMYTDVLEPVPICILKNPEEYLSLLSRDCSAGKMTITVSPAGDVRPCTHIPKTYGNLLTDSMEKIWNAMSEFRDGSFVPEKCELCSELASCSLGCREASKTHFGNYAAEDPWTVGFGPLEKKMNLKDDVVNFNENDKFSMIKDIKYRKEGDNYLLFSQSTYAMAIVNNSFFSIIQHLNKLNSFTINTLLEPNVDKENLQNILNYLAQKRFLVNLGARNPQPAIASLGPPLSGRT